LPQIEFVSWPFPVFHDICNHDGTINQAQCVHAAQTLFDHSEKHQGLLHLIVVHSPTLAIAITSNEEITTRKNFDVDSHDIASSVGAGDAFAAGMLYGLHEGWSLESSLELAHATAAASLRSPTAVGSVESVESVLKFAR